MPGGRPKGSTSALGARASRRNLQGRNHAAAATTAKERKGQLKWDLMADRREEARLAREEAQAVREQARARHEAGELCLRAEAIAEVTRLHRIVRAELDRGMAYIDPGLPAEVRAACESAMGTALRKLRTAIADKVAS